MSFKKRRIVSVGVHWLGAITSPHKRRVSPGRCILGGHFHGFKKETLFKGRISRTLVCVLGKTMFLQLVFHPCCIRNNMDLFQEWMV